MIWQYTPYILPLCLSAFIAALLSGFTWKRRSTPGGRPFALLMLGVAVWALGNALETASADFALQLLWARLTYLGVVITPGAWLVFALQYTNRQTWLRGSRLLLLLLEPLFTLGLIWTNEHHLWYWSSLQVEALDGFGLLTVEYGSGFWIHAMYSYLLLLAGLLLLVRLMIRSSHVYRRQVGGVILGALAPWVGNALYIFDLNPFPYLDLTPFAFTATGLIVTWSVFRLRLLDVVPLARDTVMEHLEDGLIVLDVQGRIADLNPAALRLLGADVGQSVGQSLEQGLSPFPDLAERIAGFVARGEGGGNADWLNYELRVSPLHDRRKCFTGWLVTLHDITERMHVEETLRQMWDAAETASRAKSEFLANMSHELRTPLNAIIGYSEMMAEEADSLGITASGVYDLQKINRAGQHLLDLISDVLDLAKIEAGRMELAPERFAVGKMVGDVAEMAGPLVGRRENELAVQVDAALGEMHADPVKVRQCLFNLLSNAAKFTERGRIELEVQRVDKGGREWAAFHVRDTGIGMSKEQTERIFDAFIQADTSTTRQYGGTGLGLAITLRFAQLMGGNVRVESEPGQGSHFTLSLPLRSPS